MKRIGTFAARVLRAVGLCLCVALPASGQGYSEQRPRFTKFERLGGISGFALKVILAALPELKRRGFDVAGYVVCVYDLGEYYVVLFSDPDRFADAEGKELKWPGTLGGRPGELEVEVSKKDLRPLAVRHPK